MLNVVNKPIQALLIMLCVAAVLPAVAQERTAPPALPPEAQQAFDRGLKAVQLQEWGLAVRYFTDAQKTAPHASTVLFNLGLAHARAGHELPAIAWLHAYLEATPQASNAEAIRAEIERLKTVTRGKMNAIFQTAIAAVQQLDPSDQESALYEISRCQANAGDVEGAIATRKLMHSQEETPKLSSWSWSFFYLGLIRAGDLEGAQEALENVTEAKDKNMLQPWERRVKELISRRNVENYEGTAKEYMDDWIVLARRSSSGFSGDLEKALKDVAEAKGSFSSAKTAKDRIDNLADVARNLGIDLNRIVALERKSGQGRGGK